MFIVTSTGKNERYGKKGEKRIIADYWLVHALKEGWITNYVKYYEDGRNTLRIKPIEPCKLCGR